MSHDLGELAVVCERCGGYGATVSTRQDDQPAYKERCAECGGQGRVRARPWSEWDPDPVIVDMLSGLEEREPSSE